MAKYKAKQKKAYGKTIATIMFALLFIASIAGGVYGWIKAGEYKAQLDKYAADELPDDNNDSDKPDGDNMLMTLSDNYAEMSLTAYSGTANKKSATITAIVEPVTTENKNVNFTLAMKDGSSSAQYATLTVNGNSATVTCLKAFSQQMVLTARAEGNPKLVETCTFDYLAGVADIDFFSNGYDSVFEQWSNVYSNGDGQIFLDPVMGTGTILPTEFEVTGLFFELSREFTTTIQQNHFYNELDEASSGVYTIDITNKIYLQKYYPASANFRKLEQGPDEWSDRSCYEVTTFNDPGTFFMSDDQTPYIANNSQYYEYALASFKQTARETSDNMRIGINWRGKYNGEWKGSTYYTDYFSINAEDIESSLIDGTNVKLDQSNVIFGDL